MKLQIVILMAALAISMAYAEPPRRRFVWGARIETAEAPQAAPYPPSGWRPSKPFYLPGEYGPAEEETTTEAAPETTTAVETTTAQAEEEATTTAAPEEEAVEEGRDEDYDETASANVPAPGVYYILLPDGRLQRVNYQSQAPQSGNYIIQDVGPFSAPYYAYPTLVQILKK